MSATRPPPSVEESEAGERPLSLPRRAGGYVAAALAVGLAAAIGRLLRDVVDLADLAMLFVAAIATTATFRGRRASILTSVLAVVAFDFFFVPPSYTLAVGDLRHLFTFAVMLGTGVLISTLTERVRAGERAARERETRTAALFGLARALAAAPDEDSIARVVRAQVREVFECEALLLARDGRTDEGDAGRRDPQMLSMPLAAQGRTVGVVAVRPVPEDRFEDPGQRNLLEAFATQIAIALERAQLAGEAREAALRAETEELRSSLLSSVSHDLRTPIASVLGAATTLIDSDATLSVDHRLELTATIRDEAARLGRLVGNLLDMSRVESAGLELKKEWVPLEEVVGAALTRLGARLEGRDIHLDVAPELLAPLDPVLFEQLLYNVLENALKHTPPGSPIDVRAIGHASHVEILIEDRGPGLSPGTEARIFEKFARAGGPGGGVGLGLAICRAIALAHGGTIEARAREGGGASFRVTLPKTGDAPPPMESEDDVPRSEVP